MFFFPPGSTVCSRPPRPLQQRPGVFGRQYEPEGEAAAGLQLPFHLSSSGRQLQDHRGVPEVCQVLRKAVKRGGRSGTKSESLVKFSGSLVVIKVMRLLLIFRLSSTAVTQCS